MAYSEFSNPSRIGMTFDESLRKWLKKGPKECSGFLKACLIEAEEEPRMAPWALNDIIDAYNGVEAFSMLTGISQQNLNELLIEENTHQLDDYRSIITALEKLDTTKSKRQKIATVKHNNVLKKSQKHISIVPIENKLTHTTVEKRLTKGKNKLD